MQNFSKQEFDVFNYSSILSRNPVYLRNSWNENTPFHRHSHIEFFYVLDGSGVHIFNKEENTLTYGSACLLTLNDIHGFQKIGNKDFKHMDICINDSYFKNVCDFFSPTLYKELFSNHGYAFKLSAEEISKIENCIPNLLLDSKDSAFHLSAKILTASLINLVLEQNSKQQFSPPTWLVQLLADLSSPDNFKNDLSAITSQFDYNEDYIRRQFKKFFGMTMTDYFNHQKLDYAFQLLSKSSITTEKVCEITGFNNISYFHRLFKRTFNTTPGIIRKRPAFENKETSYPNECLNHR